MAVQTLDHYNLRAARAARAVLDELCAFYRDVVGLEVGERPPFRRFGYWLYAGGRAVLHLSVADDGESRPSGVASTFAHAAFSCTNRPAFEQRLKERGVPYRVDEIPLTRRVQLFFKDPAGNGVELQFEASDAER